MKIGMLTTSFPRHAGDFAGVFVYRLARALVVDGCAVTVVAPSDSDLPSHEWMDGVEVVRFDYACSRRRQRLAYGDGIPTNLRRQPWVAAQIPAFMLRFWQCAMRDCHDCDLLHVHWSPLALPAMGVRRCHGQPVVVSVHGTDVRTLSRAFTRWVLRRADAVIVAATETQEIVNSLDISQVYPIALPVDETAFRPPLDVSDLRMILGLEEDTPVITFVGRLEPFKDPLTFVRAVPQVLTRHPKARFLVVGDGSLREKTRSSVKALGVTDYVYILGARQDVNRLLNLSTLFTALSPVENTWSMTIVEAMFAHVPCIITCVGRSERLFIHGENCFFVRPGDADDLAVAITRLLEDPALREKLILGGQRLLARHGRDTATIVRRTQALYQEVLSRRAFPAKNEVKNSL
jgi:glycosyltransferase involved in cell wall biosynthesis